MASYSTIGMTRRDANLMSRLVRTEVPSFPDNPDQEQRMIDGVVETVTNRTTTPGFPNTIEGVANQPSQFSAINGPMGRPLVANSPMASPRMQQEVNGHLFDLAAGAAPTFPGTTHYLNPNYSSPSALANWGNSVVDQGNMAGVGNSVHFYGNAPGTIPTIGRPDFNEADMQGLARSKLGLGAPGPGVKLPAAADSIDRANDYGSTAFNNVHPSLMARITSPFSTAFNAVGNMFGSSLPASSSPQVASNPIPPADVGAVSPVPQRPVSYDPLNAAPTLGNITSQALAALPSQMPARVAIQTPLIVGTQVADTPPATAPSYAEGTLGHMLSRPNMPVLGSAVPSMSMTRTTAMPPSAPAFAPAPQQQPSLPASAFASTAPQTAPTSSLQAPSMSPSAAPSIPQGVNAIQSLASGMPSLSTMGQYAGLALGSPLAGAMPAVSTLGALAAPVAGALTAPQGPVNSSVIGTPTVPGTNLPAGDPASPVNGAPVAAPSTLNKITPTLGDLKTGLVGAKIGMGVGGPIGSAAGFAIPVLGGIANRLGYGLNSSFFGGPTPNPGASPATQADVVAHAAPSVLAQVNRMGYGALPAGSDYHYGYSPFGSGISLVNNNDTEAHQIAATGPGLLGALGFGGPGSAPSLAAQAAAARTAAANDAANTAAAAAANASQGNGNGNNPSGMNKGFGSSTNSNGRNGRNKNDNNN